jgi:uncharacterized protein (TIGR02646 family)
MIRIKRIEEPKELTEQIKSQLTEEFKIDKKKSVWNKPYIRNGLLEMSNYKCCYCEESVGSGCGEMHVDHYHDKNTYPDEVVKWTNLLPSCSHCNKKKSTHDTYLEPIIDPTKTDPRNIFYMRNYRYYSINRDSNSLGKISIDVLGINDSEEKVQLRFIIGDKLCNEFHKLYNDATELRDKILTNTRKRNRLLSGCFNNLKLCTRKSRFGASMATVLQESEDYQALRTLLMKYNLWDNELEQLHKESLEICLSKDIVKKDTKK